EILNAPAAQARDAEGDYARVAVGADQQLVFRETQAASRPFDGHHVAIYLADFSGPYRRLLERGLISEDSDQHQYRFEDIIDLDSRNVLHALEHEVRSMRHPLYGRAHVNRNPLQSNRNYAPGYDALSSVRAPRA